MSNYIDTLTEMEEFRRLIQEHQRQITQLYELYERSKQHNDTRSFVMGQSIDVLAEKLNNINKDSKACLRSFEHLNMALKHFSMSDVHDKLKKLTQAMKVLMENQENTNQLMNKQSVYIRELENVLRRTYILADSQTAISNSVQESGEQIQDLLSAYTHVFPLNTPEFSPNNDVENSMPMSPLSLAQDKV